MRVSLCIPAYNEAAAIGDLLAVLPERPGFIDEVLVCANGCTDATAVIARQYARRDPGCRVIEAPLGKNLAWNRLVREARNDVVIFVDADVVPEWRAVTALCDVLGAGGVAVVGAVDEPYVPGSGSKSALARLLCTPRQLDFLSGRLYAFDRRRLGEVFVQQSLATDDGLPRLPNTILLEDLFLTAVIPPPLLHIEPRAVIRYEVSGLGDILRVVARHRAALYQAACDYPAQCGRHVARQHLSAKVRALFEALAARTPIRDKLNILGRALVRGLLPWVFAWPIGRHYRRMLGDIDGGRGGTILATSGRTVRRRATAHHGTTSYVSERRTDPGDCVNQESAGAQASDSPEPRTPPPPPPPR